MGPKTRSFGRGAATNARRGVEECVHLQLTSIPHHDLSVSRGTGSPYRRVDAIERRPCASEENAHRSRRRFKHAW